MKLRAALLPLLVFAASGVRPVLEALKPELEKAAGEAIEVRYGDAESLAREIDAGAPADLFFGDETTVARLAFDDRIDRPGIVRIGAGSLAVVSAKPPGLVLPRRFDGATAAAFAALKFRKLAVPPRGTPAGRAVAEALDASGILDEVRDRLVVADTLDGTIAFIASEKAEVAIVPASQAAESGLPSSPVEPALHGPLLEEAGLVSSSKRKAAARRTLESAVSPEAREVWKRFGFRAF